MGQKEVDVTIFFLLQVSAAGRTRRDITLALQDSQEIFQIESLFLFFCDNLQEAVKVKLSPEEARKKAEEMVRKAKEKREKEEREAEVSRSIEYSAY